MALSNPFSTAVTRAWQPGESNGGLLSSGFTTGPTSIVKDSNFGVYYPTSTGVFNAGTHSFPGQVTTSTPRPAPAQQQPQQQPAQQQAPQQSSGGGMSMSGGGYGASAGGGGGGFDMSGYLNQLAGMMTSALQPPKPPEKPKTEAELHPNGTPSGANYKDPRMQGPSWIGGANLFDDETHGQNFLGQMAARPQPAATPTPAPTPTPTTPTTPTTPAPTPTTPTTPARPTRPHRPGMGGGHSAPHRPGLGILAHLGGRGALGGIGSRGGALGSRPAAPAASRGGRWW
jgi:hypothetical protein